ncbi:MAG: glucose-6-phosphate isomerase [Deltaproteobacteria bacterium]|jgi:glucose-6-phosphate isomerase|nr:glucose-6-phosphate isomerase [Deltaproteobacteria bacterium]
MANPKKADLSLLKLDYNNLTSEALGENGLSEADLADLKDPLTLAIKELKTKRDQGLLPYLDLPNDESLVNSLKKLSQKGRKKYTDVLVLGIGGSALGTSALFTALKPLNYNALPDKKRLWPRLWVADNIDPEGFSALLDRLDPPTTLVNVISKSGSTAETMSQFMIAFDWLAKSLGKTALVDHLLVTTDPETGVLRKIVNDLNLKSLTVPPGVGGRFSVLSAVGLAPLALIGVDIEGLLAGAKSAVAAGFNSWSTNKAALFAGLNWSLASKKGRGILVFTPYADSLAKVADWFCQLWNESLGKAHKLDGSANTVSQTATKALGVTDQHSQLQTWMEGPADKTVLFLETLNFKSQKNIPKLFKNQEALAYLGGQSLGQLLSSELKGTSRALTENGRPNFTLTLPQVAAKEVGYLVQTLETATVLSGVLYGVDPLDQPGVELGKKFTYGLMGRPGFTEFLDRYNQGLSVKKKFIVS